MKNIFIVGLIITFCFCSCSSTKVFMDYDNKADISKYQTYDYDLDQNTGVNELDKKRIIKSLDSILNQSSIKQKTVIPDFKINFYVETFTVNNQSNIGVGFGGGGGNVGGGISGGIPINTSKDMVSLTIEFFDAINKELFWQAVVETRSKSIKSPDERQLFFNHIIQKALEKYPPGKDKKK